MVNQLNQSHTLTHHTLLPSLPPLAFHPPSPPSPSPLQSCPGSVPAIVLDHVGQLNDELALFILLTALEGVLLEGVAGDKRDSI